jgi:hypothetical protein
LSPSLYSWRDKVYFLAFLLKHYICLLQLSFNCLESFNSVFQLCFVSISDYRWDLAPQFLSLFLSTALVKGLVILTRRVVTFVFKIHKQLILRNRSISNSHERLAF